MNHVLKIPQRYYFELRVSCKSIDEFLLNSKKYELFEQQIYNMALEQKQNSTNKAAACSEVTRPIKIGHVSTSHTFHQVEYVKTRFIYIEENCIGLEEKENVA